MKKVKDSRLYKSPKVRRKADRFKVSCRVLTPLALSGWHSLFVAPLESIWRFVVAILILDYALFIFMGWTFFVAIGMDRFDVYAILLALAFIWAFDRYTRYSICKLLLAKRIKIKILPEHVLIGRWPFRKRLERGLITFGHAPMPNREDPAYKEAQNFYAIYRKSQRVKIAEICDPVVAPKITANCNTALEIYSETFDLDHDRA